MSKGRIDQEIAIKVTGVDDAKAADQLVSDLGKKKVKASVDVTADTKDATRDIDGLMKKVDQLDSDSATILLTSNATAIATEITDLIVEVDQLDADDATIAVKVDQIAAAKSDLDAIEAKIREVNQTPVDIDTTPARQGIDEVGKSADSSKSVLANMVGNSTQDLGALGGVAGSAGVAIGQMGEYMADAAGAGDKLGQIIRGFGGVAVPLAAVAVATQAIGGHFEKMAEDEQFANEQMQRFSQSIQGGADAAGVLRKELEDTGKLDFKVQISGPDIDVGDVTGALAAAGLQLEDFVALSELSNEQFRQWADNAERAGVSSKDLAQISLALAGFQQQEASAAQNAANNNEVLGKTLVTQRDAILAATLAQKARVDALNEADEAAKAEANTQAYIDQAAGIRQAMEAAEAYNQVVSGTDFGKAELDGAVAGMSKFHEQFFGLAQIASNTEAALDALGETVKHGAVNLDLNTEAGRANMQAVQDLAAAVDTQLAAAFDAADGDLNTFKASAQAVSDTLRGRLINELGLSEEAADDMIKQLGLMPEDVETRYELSGTEEARIKIGLLDSAIEALPKDVQAKVTQQIIAGDYVGALATVQGYYNRNPATITADANTTAANNELNNAANPGGRPRTAVVNVQVRGAEALGVIGRVRSGGGTAGPGDIAGEAGPELIRRPGRREELLTYPALVPPGTRVTSVRRTRTILARRGAHFRPMATGGIALGQPLGPITVQVNAAVIGSRYEVAKAVGQGTRDLRRLIGTRGVSA